jgi:aldehyde:ferredoxin oxidoreductase
MSKGYTGKILRVNLSNGSITEETHSDTFYRRYVGGWGIIGYYLLKELEPMIDPLGPENKLIFAAGPITGVPIPGNGRNAVGAKSPLTGGFGVGEAGGYWGAEMKHAGFDGVIFEGRSEEPVYLWMKDGEAEIRDARKLWGRYTKEAQGAIRKELDDNRVRVAGIGPGGENKVLYACIINDLTDAVGRSGLGAVMGSKNLKAVAVRGTGKVEVADAEKTRELTRVLTETLGARAEASAQQGRRGERPPYVPNGNLPIRNFQDGEFPEWADISASGMVSLGLIRRGMHTCFGCPINCKEQPLEFDDPMAPDPDYSAPEYETAASLGPCCGVGDPKAVLKGQELCNAYSIDSISTGVTIAFAMECFERGLINEGDTGGLDLRFGNGEAMLEVIRMIGERRGFGDILAEGSKRAAEKIGGDAWRYAVNVKGQEIPMHDPRLKRALGLGYAVSPTGADHMHNMHDTMMVSDSGLSRIKPMGILESLPLDDLSSKKVRMLVYFVNLRVLDNCALMCMFPPWSPSQKVEIFKAVTGWETSLWELAKVGERAINMARAFNMREGLTEKEDWLPPRMFQPQKGGPIPDTSVDPRKLGKAKKTYYRMMGWDEDTGVPTVGKLEELGIPWVTKHLVNV